MAVTILTVRCGWPTLDSPRSLRDPDILQINSSIQNGDLDAAVLRGCSFRQALLYLIHFKILEPS